jgi:hypothetical protein
MKFLLAAALLAAATPANATLQVAFSDGASKFFCADQTSCDLDGQVKNVLLLNTMVGDIRIEGTFVASSTSPDELSVSNLTITNLGTSTQTLLMAAGDIGFVGPIAAIRSSGSGTFNNDVGGSGNVVFFASPSNTQPAAFSTDLPGQQLFTTGLLVTKAPSSFAGDKTTPFSASGPFSMAEGAAITLRAGASITGFNESMATAAIPEPSTWAMMIIGAGLLASVGWKKRRQARLAF